MRLSRVESPVLSHVMNRRLLSASLVVVIVALIGLIIVLAIRQGEELAAPPAVELSDDDRAEAERIIRARINSLSPAPPKLGGKFDVSDIEWTNRGAARVTYGDGESTFEGLATVQTGSGRVKIEGFTVED